MTDRMPYPTAHAYERACAALHRLRKDLNDAQAGAAIRRAEIDRITEQRNRYRRELERAANHLEDAQAIVDPSRYLKAAERQVRGVLEVDL